MSKLGWIGMGDIGEPMALQLIAMGHELVVWGRDKTKLKPAIEKGARQAESAADVARSTEAVLICVTDTAAVEEVVFGETGVAKGGAAGKILVDHSTIHPEKTREMAARLRAEAGMGWIDAPVSGGAVGARERTLAIPFGGEPEDAARVKPWFQAYAGKATHIGPVGSGQIAKSCNQAILTSTVNVWAEVLSYAKNCGLDPNKLSEALEGGWADSNVRKFLVPHMLEGRFKNPSRTSMLKDLDIVWDMARVTKSPMPSTAVATNALRQLLALEGPEAGPTALIKLYSLD